MDNLSKVLLIKILATVLIWCIPLLFFPESVFIWIGFPSSIISTTLLFYRLLAWAYIALCVGYTFALIESIKGKRLISTIWTGIVSNGGACIILLIYGCIGTWANWGLLAQIILWGSIVVTGLITLGLYSFGIRGYNS